MRQEDIQWRRDQRLAAYEGALRYLLRGANMRSELTVQGGTFTTIHNKEHAREWFGDLVEAQFWMHTHISRCEPAQSVRLGDSTEKLDDAIKSLNAGRRSGIKTAGRIDPGGYGGIFEALDEAITSVSKCAQMYMSIETSRPSALEGPTAANPGTE